MISISGVFAVTFSVVFAYVADVTTIENRSRAYGMVSATFAASLVRRSELNEKLNVYLVLFTFRSFRQHSALISTTNIPSP